MERVLFRNSRDKFWTEGSDKDIYFYTVKDKLEIAFLEKNKRILYLNTDYKEDKYIKTIFRDIKKKYKDKYDIESEYLNMKGLDI